MNAAGGGEKQISFAKLAKALGVRDLIEYGQSLSLLGSTVDGMRLVKLDFETCTATLISQEEHQRRFGGTP